MQWNLEQLRAFVAAAETGSFSAAGRRLGRVQSAVSTQIALLEAELGVDLFDRSTRRPRLTSAGSALRDEAQEVLRQCRQLSARAEALCLNQEAELCLAVDEGLPYQAMNRMFTELAAAFPHMQVRLPHGSAREVREWVARGDVPLGVAFAAASWSSPDVESQLVGTVEQVLIAGATHPLSSLPRITRQALVRHRQIVVQVATDAAPYANLNADSGVVPDPMLISPVRWETNSSYVAAELALQGLGWTVLPVNVATYAGLPPGLRILDPGELSFPPLSVLLLRSCARASGPLGDWLLARLRAY